KVRAALAEVRRERAERAARRAGLAAEKHQREGEVREKRAALAGQLRAAYTIGRQEPLKLLLNQKDPALAGRIFAYYGYFGRARRISSGCAPSRRGSRSCCASCAPRWSAFRSRATMCSRGCAAGSPGP